MKKSSFLRTCSLVLAIIAVMTGMGFSFSVLADDSVNYCENCGAVLAKRYGEEVGHWQNTHKAYFNSYVGNDQEWAWCTRSYVQKRDVKYCPNGHGIKQSSSYTEVSHSITVPHPD